MFWDFGLIVGALCTRGRSIRGGKSTRGGKPTRGGKSTLGGTVACTLGG